MALVAITNKDSSIVLYPKKYTFKGLNPAVISMPYLTIL